MQYIIDTSKAAELNWTAKGDERILQNILNLLRTWRYEVGFDRTRGVDPSILDKTLNDAAALYTAEIYRLIEDYEPRATLKDVAFLGIDDEGNLQFKVVVEI